MTTPYKQLLIWSCW